ncbi:hypothetical protein KFE25_013397 [Diacronema lutheri]|uniref:GAF domain-containing protein n=1 Tax=Diacronema lutheri TaxID=2081491 RepID=A0A8J5XQC3_DIALT|nr:hypothetical protein KFE25_013397 [Diacronema lutheri]
MIRTRGKGSSVRTTAESKAAPPRRTQGVTNASRIADQLDSLGACYAILWKRANDDVLRAVQYHALDGAVMENSRSSHYRAGTGAVGRVWATRRTELVRDASTASIAQFDRVHLATYYRVRSVALAYVDDGVVEVGSVSRAPWDKPPDVRVLHLLLSGVHVPFDHVAPLPAAAPTTHRSADALADAVRSAGGTYAIFWQHVAARNDLTPTSWYALDNACMKRSTTFASAPGLGPVGRAWLSQEPGLIADVRAAESEAFDRRLLAAHFGIRSIAFVPSGGGVLEIGADRIWECVP